MNKKFSTLLTMGLLATSSLCGSAWAQTAPTINGIELEKVAAFEVLRTSTFISLQLMGLNWRRLLLLPIMLHGRAVLMCWLLMRMVRLKALIFCCKQ